MIHFAPEVGIQHFTFDFAPVLLSASMWSNRERLPVTVWDVQQGLALMHAGGNSLLVIDLSCETSPATNLDSLGRYMASTLPNHFKVERIPNKVRVRRVLLDRKHPSPED